MKIVVELESTLFRKGKVMYFEHLFLLEHLSLNQRDFVFGISALQEVVYFYCAGYIELVFVFYLYKMLTLVCSL